MAEHGGKRHGAMMEVVGGAVIGFVMAVSFLSYVALIFSGPLAAGQGAGLAMIVPALLVIGLGTLWKSGARTALGAPDNNVIAVMASFAAAIAGDIMASGAGRADAAGVAVATVVVGLALASLGTGIALMVLARLGAGRLVRFLPLQMTVAFEGTAGWQFTSGGIGLVLPDASFADMFADPTVVAQFAATVTGALALVAVGYVRLGRLSVPGTILTLIVAHHAAFLFFNLSPEEAARWLMPWPEGRTPALAWLEPLSAGVAWDALGDHLGGLAALVLLGVVTVFVNLVGQEEMDGQDLDMDRELTTAGAASVASGGLGGIGGSLNPELGRLLQDAGGGGRLSAGLAVILAAVLPLALPGLVTQVPVTVLGAVLLSMGLKFGFEWVLSSNKALSWREWPTVIVVITVAAMFGAVAAVLVGLVVGTIGFAVVYARAAPITARYRGDIAMSRVERPPEDVEYLKAHASARLALHLQGYLFFGTAARIEEDVRDEIVRAAGALDTVVLDFAEVDGIDVSAAAAIESLARFAARRGTTLVLASLPLDIYAAVLGGQRATKAMSETFATLDQALEWTEERLLDRREGVTAGLVTEDPMFARVATTLGLAPQDIPAGTVVIRQGEQSADLIFVLSGRVGITMRHGRRPPVRVRTFTAGTMVGEIGFFLGSLRTATVVAEENCRILALSRADLERLRGSHPEQALALMTRIEERLCLRIRDKDQLIDGLLRSSRYLKGG
jgi:SulP family sulfate permease